MTGRTAVLPTKREMPFLIARALASCVIPGSDGPSELGTFG